MLVGTPGRLVDHLEGTKGMADWIKHVGVFILDEADAMLELGFQPAIKNIVSYLPADRQTLLFTATVPKACLEVAELAVKKDYQFLNCIPKDQ